MKLPRLSKYIKVILWVLLVLAVILIVIAASRPQWVETYYTYGLYPYISRCQRWLLGWLPLSLGDIGYLLVGCRILWVGIRMLKSVKARRIRRAAVFGQTRSLLFLLLLVFVMFYGFWGLNYSRVGISGQLQLVEARNLPADLDTLVYLLQHRLNREAALAEREGGQELNRRDLFRQGAAAYQHLAGTYPFLEYRQASVKPSVFSYLGNYMGFQGYYNPFTGEAQVNTTVPYSELPFVTVHELAHQLGYAREQEANFVGFLACQHHPLTDFRYSGYFNMYRYALRQLSLVDSVKAAAYQKTAHPRINRDIETLYRFYRRYQNPVEPLISLFYDYFLKANQQPMGTATYSEVVRWLIAYYKKYGQAAL